jgi:hypothetical protein
MIETHQEQNLDVGVVKGVKHHLSTPSTLDEAQLPQHAQMLRDRRRS